MVPNLSLFALLLLLSCYSCEVSCFLSARQLVQKPHPTYSKIYEKNVVWETEIKELKQGLSDMQKNAFFHGRPWGYSARYKKGSDILKEKAEAKAVAKEPTSAAFQATAATTATASALEAEKVNYSSVVPAKTEIPIATKPTAVATSTAPAKQQIPVSTPAPAPTPVSKPVAAVPVVAAAPPAAPAPVAAVPPVPVPAPTSVPVIAPAAKPFVAEVAKPAVVPQPVSSAVKVTAPVAAADGGGKVGKPREKKPSIVSKLFRPLYNAVKAVFSAVFNIRTLKVVSLLLLVLTALSVVLVKKTAI